MSRSAQEKRHLIRNQILPGGVELHGLLTVGGRTHQGTIVDFHSSGAKLNLGSVEIVPGETGTLAVEYGRVRIGESIPCRVARADDDGLGLAFLRETSGGRNRRSERLATDGPFAPILSCLDPVRLDQKLFFRVLDLSQGGLRLATSLSNRHLLPGMRISGGELVLPTVGTVAIDFRVKAVEALEREIRLGIELLNPPKETRVLLAAYLFQHGREEGGSGLRVIREELQVDPRDLGRFFRLYSIATKEEYEEVLRIRHQAFLFAKKIAPETSPAELADEYDKNSVILVARAGGRTVGTVRLANSKNGSPLPLERYFKLPPDLEEQRGRLSEISKLAILPDFQGSDLVIKFFQEIARMVIANEKVGVCLSTDELKPMYLSLGARQTGLRAPHYSLPGEYLNLLILLPEDFVAGRGMYGLTWKKVAQRTLDNLRRHGFIGSPGAWVRARMAFKQIVESGFLRLTRRGRGKSARKA